MNPAVARAGTTSDVLFNHYSLLKTADQLLGLPFLGHANDSTVTSMKKAFGLQSRRAAGLSSMRPIGAAGMAPIG